MAEPKPICDLCGERVAEVFTTRATGAHSLTRGYCAGCAHQELGDFAFESGPQFNASLKDHMDVIFPGGFVDESPDPFDETNETFVDDAFEDDAFDFPPSDSLAGEGDAHLEGALMSQRETPENVARCARCGTTWDTIRTDGRAGCAACYLTFAARIAGVMERVQRGVEHAGKTPRAAHKRQLRLEQLRQRRDNQLQMLQTRLQRAVASEHFEEAAKLRDKIKIVSATIWNESA